MIHYILVGLYYIEVGIVYLIRFFIKACKKIISFFYGFRPISKTEIQNIAAWKDKIVYKSSGQLFGYLENLIANDKEDCIEITIKGWIFHPKSPIAKIVFTGLDADNSITIYGSSRHDVRYAFNSCSYSLTSGFHVVANVTLDQLQNLSQDLTFVVTLADSSEILGTFGANNILAWPQLPWAESQELNAYNHNQYQDFRNKNIVLFKAGSEIQQIDENAVYVQYVGNPEKFPDYQTGDCLTIFGLEELRAFIVKIYPIASSIKVVGEDLYPSVYCFKEIELSFLDSAKISFA